jgi:hypothetical protein
VVVVTVPAQMTTLEVAASRQFKSQDPSLKLEVH